MQTKLKISNSRLQILPTIVLNYIDHLAEAITIFRYEIFPTNQEDYYLSQISIGYVLYEKFNRHTIKRYPAKQPTIKLELHESILLYNALKYHESNTENNYTRSIASQLAEELHKQKPSISQINLKTLITS